jgi:hypothetical protein
MRQDSTGAGAIASTSSVQRASAPSISPEEDSTRVGG